MSISPASSSTQEIQKTDVKKINAVQWMGRKVINYPKVVWNFLVHLINKIFNAIHGLFYKPDKSKQADEELVKKIEQDQKEEEVNISLSPKSPTFDIDDPFYEGD